MLTDHRIEQERWARENRERRKMPRPFGNFIAGRASWDRFVNPLSFQDGGPRSASRQEVIAAKQPLNHPDRSVVLLGPDATESKFRSQPLGNFTILHFAVHGLSDPQFPDRAALVLARDPNSSDDGLLEFQAG